MDSQWALLKGMPTHLPRGSSILEFQPCDILVSLFLWDSGDGGTLAVFTDIKYLAQGSFEISVIMTFSMRSQ